MRRIWKRGVAVVGSVLLLALTVTVAVDLPRQHDVAPRTEAVSNRVYTVPDIVSALYGTKTIPDRLTQPIAVRATLDRDEPFQGAPIVRLVSSDPSRPLYAQLAHFNEDDSRASAVTLHCVGVRKLFGAYVLDYCTMQ